MKLEVPQYYQSEDDNSCGPVAIRMAADYYYKKEQKEMTAIKSVHNNCKQQYCLLQFKERGIQKLISI
jgi:hypothetical protein